MSSFQERAQAVIKHFPDITRCYRANYYCQDKDLIYYYFAGGRIDDQGHIIVCRPAKSVTFTDPNNIVGVSELISVKVIAIIDSLNPELPVTETTLFSREPKSRMEMMTAKIGDDILIDMYCFVIDQMLYPKMGWLNGEQKIAICVERKTKELANFTDAMIWFCGNPTEVSVLYQFKNGYMHGSVISYLDGRQTSHVIYDMGTYMCRYKKGVNVIAVRSPTEDAGVYTYYKHSGELDGLSGADVLSLFVENMEWPDVMVRDVKIGMVRWWNKLIA